jgi:hypothetical protein
MYKPLVPCQALQIFGTRILCLAINSTDCPPAEARTIRNRRGAVGVGSSQVLHHPTAFHAEL